MKRMLIFLIALVSIVASLSAEPSSYMKISSLIESGAVRNKDQISLLSSGLSSSEAMMLYNSNKMDTGLPFALNLLLGCGIGSFVQGDTAGGVTGLAVELAGYSAVLAGYAVLSRAALSGASGTYNSLSYAGAGLIIGGGIIFLGIRIYELVRPFSYADKYNRTLFEALNSGYGTSLALAPVLSPDDGLSGIAALASISF